MFIGESLAQEIDKKKELVCFVRGPRDSLMLSGVKQTTTLTEVSVVEKRRVVMKPK